MLFTFLQVCKLALNLTNYPQKRMFVNLKANNTRKIKVTEQPKKIFKLKPRMETLQYFAFTHLNQFE